MEGPQPTWSVERLASFVARVSDALDLPDLDPDRPLVDQGLDSLDMFVLFAEVSDVMPWACVEDLTAAISPDTTLRDIWLACLAQKAHNVVKGS